MCVLPEIYISKKAPCGSPAKFYIWDTPFSQSLKYFSICTNIGLSAISSVSLSR